MTRAQPRSLRELIGDRIAKRHLYGSPRYWDMKSREYSGLARSNWPSNAYNERVHAVQMRLVSRALGEVRGRRVLDVGCGTGRLSHYLAVRGAVVTGWDFSATALDAAGREARARGLRIEFEQVDITRPVPDRAERFDVIVSIGCLTLACSEYQTFERALANLVRQLAPDGKLLFVEPIHESRVLARLLRMSRAEWRERCEAAALALCGAGHLLFAPARFLLAFRELPLKVVDPLFDVGERVLNLSPRLGRLADYHWLLFERAGDGPSAGE